GSLMALDIVITSIDEVTNTSCKIHYTAASLWSSWYDADVIETPDDGSHGWSLSEYWVRLFSLEANTEYDVYIKGKENVGDDWENSNTETFTTANIGGDAPEKPINPKPTDAADDVVLDQETIIWENGGGATSYDVYYGDTSGSLSLVSDGQEALSYTIDGVTLGSPFDYLITRYWRIDAINDVGIITGDEWSFVSIAFDPPLPTGVTLDADGNPTGTPTGESGMMTVRRLVAAAYNKMWYESI
ncbi:unnamed protein product, partial [marine sediment metagenome]